MSEFSIEVPQFFQQQPQFLHGRQNGHPGKDEWSAWSTGLLEAGPTTCQVSPEMIGALLLPKATPRHNADASLFQEPQAEEHVRGQAQFLGVRRGDRVTGWRSGHRLEPQPTPCSAPHLSTLHCFQGQLHSRERVHGALHWVAVDPGCLVEDLLREFSLGGQFSQHLLPLLQSQEGIMEEGFHVFLYSPTQSWITRYLWPGLVCSLLETA